MWMEFIAGANYLLTITGTPANAAISAVAFAGGKLIIAENGANGAGLYIFDFSNGQTLKYTNISAQTFIPGLSDPNSTQIAITLSTSTTAPSAYINALATYTAPDAPLDAVTGMPTPVVGGVTQGGAFMILEGGTVTQDSVGAAMDCCAFDMLGNFISKVYSSTIPRVYATESAEWRSASWNRSSLALIGESTTPALTDSPNQIVSVSQEIVSTHEDGVDLLRLNPNTPTNSLIAKIGSNFNTGWMCKPLAAVMCDTDTGSIADTELVTNGSFDTDIAGWTDGSTGTGSISWDAGAIVLTNGGSSSDQGMASQNIVTVTGQTYKCVVDREIGTSIIQIDLSSTYQSPNEAVDAEFYFTAASSSTNIRLINFSNTGDSKIASITVQAVSPDRSGQDNHYDIEGTLTRTAEETGGIALYSGFSADPDALRRAYESAWDVGTAGDFFVRGVAKFSGSVSAATVWCRGDTGASGNRVLLTVNASETFRAVINGTERVAAAGAYNDGSVHTWCLARIAGTLYLIIDGETVDSAANTDDVDNASAITRIGLDYTGASPFDVGSIGMVQESPGCTTTLQEIKTWHHDTARIIESGTVTLANTITAAHYDERNGVTRLLDSDSQELQLNGLVIESSRDFDAGDSIDVGTVAAGASDGRGRATGGSTALQLEVEAKNMREEQPRRAYEYFDIKYEGDGTETSFPSADADIAAVEGCYPIAVTDAGSKQTEGSADDYTVEFDGFNYWAEFAVAPSNTNDVIVTWRREVRK